jgi:hypothetical protein
MASETITPFGHSVIFRPTDSHFSSNFILGLSHSGTHIPNFLLIHTCKDITNRIVAFTDDPAIIVPGSSNLDLALFVLDRKS